MSPRLTCFRTMFGRLAMIFAVVLGLSACATSTPAEVALARNGFTRVDVACLAEALYFEARGTGEAGRRAVGEVILNRVEDERFPNTVCAVIDDNCQFSYRCDSIPNNQFNEPEALSRAERTAMTLLTNRQEDITSGALFFHAQTMNPGSWFGSLPRVGLFGGNIFYRG